MNSSPRSDIRYYFMRLASLAAERSTCLRTKVGCVLVDQYNRVMSTGYNGVYKSGAHCLETGCKVLPTDKAALSVNCVAVHAEQNALLQCSDVMKIKRCFVTKAPCITCLKMLRNTSCEYIYFLEEGRDTQEVFKLHWNRNAIKL